MEGDGELRTIEGHEGVEGEAVWRERWEAPGRVQLYPEATGRGFCSPGAETCREAKHVSWEAQPWESENLGLLGPAQYPCALGQINIPKPQFLHLQHRAKNTLETETGGLP